MVSNPADKPVTRPEAAIKAWLFEALHEPPVAVDVRVVVAPTHTAEAPESVPAPGIGFTVIANELDAVPQVLTTV
jgi:hypothetical protein